MPTLTASRNTVHNAVADSAAHYDLLALLPQLRDEVDYLTTASAVSPAALYYPPQTAAANLDKAHRDTLTAITSNIHTVQPLVIHPGADKTGLLDALAATAHHHNHKVLALPASEAAARYAADHRYADTTVSPEQAQTNLGNQRWKLPRGTLIVIDDADQLPARQLRSLTRTATTTNSKLILITTPESHSETAHTLLDVLIDNLPGTHHVGTPTPRHRNQPGSAIARAEHHLDVNDDTPTPEYAQAAELLNVRTALLRRLDDMAAADATLDDIAGRQKKHDRDRNRRGHGLEL